MNENTETTAEAEQPKSPAERKFPGLVRNYLSFLGIAVVAACLTSIGLLILVELSSGVDNPYTVLVTYILLPSVMVFGILLILAGMLLERRRRRKNPDTHIPVYPIIDLNDPARRRTALVFLCLSFIFLFISAFGSYRAFEYTESTA